MKTLLTHGRTEGGSHHGWLQSAKWTRPQWDRNRRELFYLQDFPGDVHLAVLTLDAKHGVVVHLTVGDSIPERRTQRRRIDERGSVWTWRWGQLIGLFLAIQTSTINTDHLQVSDINFVIVIKPHFSTYLLMYSALSTLLQTLHLKQPRCQCLSSATRDCSFLNSFPQPQQSEQRGEDWMKESERVDASRPDLMNVMTEIPRLRKDFWLCGGFGCVIDAVQSWRLERRGTDCGQPVWVLGCWQGEAGYTFGRRTPSRWKSLGRRLGTAVCKQTQNTGSHLVSSRLPSGFYFGLNHIFVFWKLVFFNA